MKMVKKNNYKKVIKIIMVCAICIILSIYVHKFFLTFLGLLIYSGMILDEDIFG